MNDTECLFVVGMDLPDDLDASAVDEFNEFYTHEHLPEMLADAPGFMVATRYELMTPAPGCPRFLATYQVASRSDGSRFAERMANRGAQPPSPGPVGWERKQTLWRFMYARADSHQASTHECPFLFTVWMTIPEESSDSGLAEFNDYYTNVHVPEVVAAYPGFVNGTRYELTWDPLDRGTRFLATYGLDSEESARLHIASMREPSRVAFTPGPEVWRQHVTRWRLVYRRIATYTAP